MKNLKSAELRLKIQQAQQKLRSLEEQANITRQEIHSLNKELESAIAVEMASSDNPLVKVYRLGPCCPNGILDRKVLLKNLDPDLQETLLRNGMASFEGGVNPVNWSGRKYVLIG